MQEKHLYEYAVIRVVPSVVREEFLNIGVILYCKQQRYLQTLFSVNGEKIRCLAPEFDMEELRAYLTAFEKIAAGAPDAGPIAKLDLPSRFRWLTATRSTVIQSSKIHPGLCGDLAGTLQRLHAQLVL
ncbi:DUF3037 domain-containing protein [Chitinophaga sancti]|uniref:DUF3037 domain-containing protein n=1 Tax=Chitinophaga sancti TaxID=1004 RepID=A0A1K1LQA7_9BACT|nr:DUF3037 domain-containing protein [Chitinophaga sancti]WQD64935.1 DUF3037 domain-containing protein [Chitinophaga sancti]WQG89441.1 DUF3037 domain-containing protein [Chitinophaga sancti]SFW13027.1 Protein of unknown function [Chitinophaga sancti]